MAKPSTVENHLLACIPRRDFKKLEPFLERHTWQTREPLHEPGKPLTHVYFPIDGVASLVTSMEGGSAVEAATVGNEGMVGLPMFLETGTVPIEAFVQIPGETFRMKAALFRSEVKKDGILYDIVQIYTQVLLRLIAQSAACNRLHSLRQRCARWLLMSHDRVRGDAFLLTQEFLSMMLGVRRATVTVAASQLRREGWISYRQGRIHVTNREGLERAACECYLVIRREFDRLAEYGRN